MKKQKMMAMAVVVGLVGSMSLPVEAAKVYSVGGNDLTKGCIIVNGQTCNLPEGNSILKDLCDKLQNGNWSDCPVITLPNCNQPNGDGNQSEPDNGQPEDNVSDSIKPGGETNRPEHEQPEISIPEGDTNQPEMDNGQPGDNNSGSVNPDGETNKPEIEDELQEELSYVRQVAKLVNEERAKAGLHPLVFDTKIASAAQIRANEIKTSFSHTRPDGRNFSTVLTDNGIRFTGAGENIAWGQKTPEQVMKAWMNSEGHRANILNVKYTKIGVGQYRDASGRNYWVQLFAY